MAHQHNAECRRLHGIIEGMVARKDIPSMNIGLSNGTDISALTPVPTMAALESDDSDAGNLDLEIASVRSALTAMGCSG